jgi:hypothetical protein
MRDVRVFLGESGMSETFYGIDFAETEATTKGRDVLRLVKNHETVAEFYSFVGWSYLPLTKLIKD